MLSFLLESVSTGSGDQAHVDLNRLDTLLKAYETLLSTGDIKNFSYHLHPEQMSGRFRKFLDKNQDKIADDELLRDIDTIAQQEGTTEKTTTIKP